MNHVVGAQGFQAALCRNSVHIRIGHGDHTALHIGLIAEEVERYLPIIVPKDQNGRPASVRYSLLSVLLLEEMKKLNIEITELKRNFDSINGNS